MFDKDQTIANFDPELWQSIQQEDQRQEQHIELIASENYTSPAVMEAQGGKMTNKYAEGYPGKRYYGGCEFVDVAGLFVNPCHPVQANMYLPHCPPVFSSTFTQSLSISID